MSVICSYGADGWSYAYTPDTCNMYYTHTGYEEFGGHEKRNAKSVRVYLVSLFIRSHGIHIVFIVHLQ